MRITFNPYVYMSILSTYPFCVFHATGSVLICEIRCLWWTIDMLETGSRMGRNRANRIGAKGYILHKFKHL